MPPRAGNSACLPSHGRKLHGCGALSNSRTRLGHGCSGPAHTYGPRLEHIILPPSHYLHPEQAQQ